MTEVAKAVDQAVARIQRVAARKGGIAALAEEAGVPYTTVHSFARRGEHKHFKVIDQLNAAASRIEERDGRGAA